MDSNGFWPPSLGIGLMYFPELHGLFERFGHVLDVIEIEPQTMWHRGRAGTVHRLDENAYTKLAALPQPKLLHGVGMPLASRQSVDWRQLPAWQHSIECLSPVWVSEHLAFMRTTDPASHNRAHVGSVDDLPHTHHAGFLLPPLQDWATVEAAVQQIRQLRDASGCPLAFEIAPNYLRPQAGDLADGLFYAQVAEQADCGILVDLHNLWCNECNGRARVEDVLAALPPERVWEIHFAGGQKAGNHWLDAHMGQAPDILFEIAEKWLPRLPRVGALVFEVMPEAWLAGRFDEVQLYEQLLRMRVLWDGRTGVVSNHPQPSRQDALLVADQVAPAPLDEAAGSFNDDWYQQFAAAVNRRSDALAWPFDADPGVAIYRELIDNVRGSMIADGLTLSWRLMMLTLGSEATDACLRDFWRMNWPQSFALDEMYAFAKQVTQWLDEGRLYVPHLQSVLAYELARAEQASPGRLAASEIRVAFDVHPVLLLEALMRGELPRHTPSEGLLYEVVVTATA